MRWGLIGTHGLVDRGGKNAFDEADNAELISVLSSDADRAKEFGSKHGVETATADMSEFLAADGLEAVWVASPTYLHHEQGMAAIDAGRHVLLEKPLAYDAKGAWELVEAAKKAGVKLATGYQGRYVPAHANMKRLLDEGAIGEPSVARTYYGIHRPGPPPEWRQKRESARWAPSPTWARTTSTCCGCSSARSPTRRATSSAISASRPTTPWEPRSSSSPAGRRQP